MKDDVKEYSTKIVPKRGSDPANRILWDAAGQGFGNSSTEIMSSNPSLPLNSLLGTL